MINFTINQISQNLENTYAELIAATRETQRLTAEQSKAQVALTEARQAILLQYAENPKDLGSNEAARNARIDELTATQKTYAREMETDLTVSRDRQAIAGLEVEHWRAQLHCAEVAAAPMAAVIGGAQ